MISLTIEEKADSDWNSRLLCSNQGTIYQTKEFSDYLQTTTQEPIFLKFLDSKGEIVGQLLISKKIRTKLEKFSKIVGGIKRGKNYVIKWSYGPVIFDETKSIEIYDKLVEYLKSRNPLVNGTTHPFSTQLSENFKNFFEIKEWCTFILDLQKNKDEIYKNIDKHSARKNIDRAIKRGVIIEEITAQKNLEEYNNLINKKKKEMNSDLISLEERKSHFNFLSKVGYRGFLAKLDGTPISGLFFSHFNKYMIESGLARSSTDYEKKLYSQDLIKWKIIEWGIENNMNWFDFAGANPKPENQKEEGILRYKKKWGGKKHLYYLIKK